MTAKNQEFPTLQTISFWQLHIAGWVLFWSGDALFIVMQHIKPGEIIAQALDAPIGCLLALLLRSIYLRLDYRRISILLLLVVAGVGSIIFSLLWLVVITSTRYALVGPESYEQLLFSKFAVVWIGRTVSVWFGWSALYFGVKFWRDWDAEKRRAQKSIILAQSARLQMLRYQVNPHFLFNALNSVRSLIDEDKAIAKGMISELSSFLRYSLQTSDQSFSTLAEELKAVRHYLSIEKKRFETNLDVSFDIDPCTNEATIPGFLLHPFVENAIKYGMKTSPMPLRIRITAACDMSDLVLAIVNSGSWKLDDHQGNGTGIGLENVRERLEVLYPRQHSLDLFEAEGFVTASIRIPMRSPE